LACSQTTIPAATTIQMIFSRKFFGFKFITIAHLLKCVAYSEPPLDILLHLLIRVNSGAQILQ
jgi:hypothetical protein